MSGLELALAGFVGMLALIAIRMPIGLAMLTAGSAGYLSIAGWPAFLNYMKSTPYFLFSNYTLSVVPLEIAASGGAGEDERGLAAGLLNTSMQLGSATGLAVVATVVAASSGGGEADPESLVVGLRWGLLTCVGFAGLALLIVLWGLPKGEPPDERAAP